MRYALRLQPLIFALALLCLWVPAGALELEQGGQYKRIHLRALQAILNDQTDEAIQALQDYASKEPDDPETWYMLAVAHSQRGAVDDARAAAAKAVELGLPAERFLAGPHGPLHALLRDAEFQQFATERASEPIHGPMLGCVTHKSAAFWVRTFGEKRVHINIMLDPLDKLAVAHGEACTSTAEDFTAVLKVKGLRPETTYYYELRVGEAGEIVRGVFHTFPKPGKPGAFRIVFGGGAGYVPPHEHMWNTIRAHKPDAFLALGDNVYIDTPTWPEVQRYCYYRRQSRPEWRALVAGTPFYAIYDDHDFGENDCWCGAEIDDPMWKRPVWRVFQQNWVNPYYGCGDKQPGCWFDFSMGDVDIFMLDCRYYRTDPEQPNPSMLGPAQKQWLFKRLRKSKGTFRVLASSVPWASGTKPGSLDTWDGFPAEREEIFSFLEKHRINGVILLSADRHRSDAWRIPRPNGYDFYEFESSRLTNQHVHKTMEQALFSYNATQSFGLLSFDTRKDDPEVTYNIINIDGECVYTLNLKHSQLKH